MVAAVRLLALGTVDSTNRYARDHFDELADGTLVTAESQTAGRGRRGRTWVSPPGVNFYGSLVVKSPGEAATLGYLAGLGALGALRELYPAGNFFIKWPNDVYSGACKIAGVLCESARLGGGRITGSVLGIGINVNLPPAALAALDQPATSLLALSGHEFDRKKVAATVAKSLFWYYSIYSRFPDRLFAEWRQANRLLGREIELEWNDGVRRRGVFADLAPDGALVFEAEGQRTLCRCGDVRIERNSIDWNRFSET